LEAIGTLQEAVLSLILCVFDREDATSLEAILEEDMILPPLYMCDMEHPIVRGTIATLEEAILLPFFTCHIVLLQFGRQLEYRKQLSFNFLYVENATVWKPLKH
jgi:hypothetical protein